MVDAAIYSSDYVSLYSWIGSGDWGIYAGGEYNGGFATENTPLIFTTHVRATGDMDMMTNGYFTANVAGDFSYSRAYTDIGGDAPNNQFFNGNIFELLVFNPDRKSTRLNSSH